MAPDEQTEFSRVGSRSKPQPGLHLVATPIGNLGDITLRALETLKNSDVILCEDTRVTGKLCRHFGIKSRMEPYHEHNAEAMRPHILDWLRGGKIISLVSDAGTPLISDPGYKLVQDVQEEGLSLTSLPGASAVLTALTLSGLPTDRFCFAGFLPAKKEARRQALESLRDIPATLVLLESPKRLAESLAAMADLLGPREAAVTRELTKLYEEVVRAPLPELATHYAGQAAPKGEITLVIGPPEEKVIALEDVEQELAGLLETLSTKDAARLLAERTGLPRSDLYDKALELKKK